MVFRSLYQDLISCSSPDMVGVLARLRKANRTTPRSPAPTARGEAECISVRRTAQVESVRRTRAPGCRPARSRRQLHSSRPLPIEKAMPKTPSSGLFMGTGPAGGGSFCGRHPELVPDESPAAALLDRRAADPACAVLHAPTGRELLDEKPL
jgi:hypothetical protein